MPNRHVPFGIEVSKRLLDGIETFERRFGVDDLQVRYAVGLLKAYYALHEQTALSSLDEFWPRLKQCVEKHNDVPAAEEPHFSFVDFYAKNEMPFPIFAASRHTVRNYTDKDIPITDIEKAVSVAMTAPSACNRQHCKVYCISDRDKINAVCEVQSGARGFGHLSNKLLVVVANVEDAVWLGERHDLYVNGGMFLMNLCYALHYQKIAHCILTWARGPSEDSRLRELLPIRDSESIVALLTCGIAPEEFDIAASPRKMVKECFEAI